MFEVFCEGLGWASFSPVARRYQIDCDAGRIAIFDSHKEATEACHDILCGTGLAGCIQAIEPEEGYDGHF